MKELLFSTYILFTTESTRRLTCDKIDNGTYYAVIDSFHKYDFERYELKINDTLAYIKQDSIDYYYKIEQPTNCKFTLTNLYPQDTSTMTKFQKSLSGLGEPFYEVTKINSDTLYFEYRRNLHIIFYSGRFIRKKMNDK